MPYLLVSIKSNSLITYKFTFMYICDQSQLCTCHGRLFQDWMSIQPWGRMKKFLQFFRSKIWTKKYKTKKPKPLSRLYHMYGSFSVVYLFFSIHKGSKKVVKNQEGARDPLTHKDHCSTNELVIEQRSLHSNGTCT